MHPPRPSTVAIYSPGWPPGRVVNGLVTYAAQVRTALLQHGVRVFILTDRVVGEPGSPDVVDLQATAPQQGFWQRMTERIYERLDCSDIAGFGVTDSIAHQLARLVNSAGVELFQMEESFGWVTSIRRFVDVPTVARLAGPWFLCGANLGVKPDWRFKLRIYREGKALTRADGILAPSGDVLERTRAYYAAPLPQARVIPNPVPPPSPEECWDVASCDRDLVLFVGRFDRLKGGDILLRAFKLVLQKRPQTRLCFAGPDAGLIDEDGRKVGIETYLSRLFPDASERGQITWLGHQPHQRIAALRRESFITVVSSRYETLCNAALEALRVGSPLVAANAGGLAELVTDGQNGLCFDVGDANELAQKLLLLLEDPRLAESLGRTARQWCREKYDPLAVGEQILALYADTVQAHRRLRGFDS
jgi:glycosyltransferase involved in cell wall biosynthesis